MKKLKLILAYCVCLALCACSSNGVGDKLVVRAIYVEKQDSYAVQMLALKADTNADTGDIKEQMVTLSGEGETLYAAMLKAEQSENREIFYGQNEILLMGPNVSRSGLFEACEYLAKESSGRPNMAVYGVNLTKQQMEKLGDAGLDLLENINQIEASGFYKTYLYELSTATKSGVLPIIEAQEDGKAQPIGLNLYQNETPYLQLDKNATELAALLMGQRGKFHFSLNLQNEPASFDLHSYFLRFDAAVEENTLGLDICLSGKIHNLVAENGMVKPQESEALMQQINTELQHMVEMLVAETIGRENDVFALASPMKNADEALFYKLYANSPADMQAHIQPKINLEMK